MPYKCYYPGCNKSYDDPVALGNHQRKCGKDAEKILKKRIKRRKLEDARCAKEHSRTGGGESSQAVEGATTAYRDMDADSEKEGTAAQSDYFEVNL